MSSLPREQRWQEAYSAAETGREGNHPQDDSGGRRHEDCMAAGREGWPAQ